MLNHYLSKHAAQRQVPARASNPNILGRVLDNPVLLHGVPAGDVLPGDVEADSDGRVRLDGNSLEATKLLHRVVASAAGKVQLRYLVTRDGASVLDRGVNAEKNVVQARVATQATASLVDGLGGAIVRVLGDKRGRPIVLIPRSFGEVRGIEPRVVVKRHTGEVGGESVVGWVHAEVTKGGRWRCVASERYVGRGVQVHNLQVRV